MKGLSVLFLLILFVCNVIAQIDFEPAFYIDNDENRVECLIKDIDWFNTPDSIQYKMNEQGAILYLNVADASLFQVTSSKYIRKKALIDLSRTNIDELSTKKQAEYIEKVVFLKYLIEGEKSLLFYRGDGVERYFIEIEGDVVPLVCKSFINEEGKIGKNTRYIGQLISYLGVNKSLITKIGNASYNYKSLIDVFEFYHQETCEECISFEDKQEHIMYFMPRIGVGRSILLPHFGGVFDDLAMSSINYRLGAEWEYILPFNKAIWSIFIDPSITLTNSNRSSFKSSLGEDIIASYNLNIVKLPIGFRYHQYLSKTIEIQIDISYYRAITWNSSLCVENLSTTEYVYPLSQESPSFTFAVGFKYENFVAQIRRDWVLQDLIRSDLTKSALYASDIFSIAYQFRIN